MKLYYPVMGGAVVFTIAIIASAIGRTIESSAVLLPEMTESSLDELVPLLNVRRDVITNGFVSFSEYKAHLEWDDFQSLVETIAATHEGANLAEFSVVDWLGSIEVSSVEAWQGFVASRAGTEIEDRSRIQGLDTTQQSLDKKASERDANSMRVFARIITWSDGVTRKQYRSDRSLLVFPVADDSSELSKFDLTALDWSPALDPQREIPDLQVTVHRIDTVYLISYVDLIDNEFPTFYRFDAERDCAPLSVEMRQNDSIVQLIIYGYPLDPWTDIHVPSVVVHGQVQASGLVKTEIREVHHWSLSVEDDALDFQLPPVYLRVDRMHNPDQPVAEVILPPYLDGVDPSQYAVVATEYIVAAFGTNDASADYNMDGIVSEADIYLAMELFGSP